MIQMRTALSNSLLSLSSSGGAAFQQLGIGHFESQIYIYKIISFRVPESEKSSVGSGYAFVLLLKTLISVFNVVSK